MPDSLFASRYLQLLASHGPIVTGVITYNSFLSLWPASTRRWGINRWIQHKSGTKQQEQCDGTVVVTQSEGVKKKEKCSYLPGKFFINLLLFFFLLVGVCNVEFDTI